MKTISAYLNINNHGHNQLITPKKPYRNHKYYQNYDKAAGDINRNAMRSEAEYQRDACEEELYRLRYGIENLLANNEQGDFKFRQRQRFAYEQNPSRTMTNRITDFHNRKNEDWIERCTPSCRRWRRNKYDDDANIFNEYAYRRVYNDRNYDLPTRRTSESPVQPQLYSDSYMSTSPSPSISPGYIDPNRMHQTKNDLRQSIDNLISRNTPNKTDILDLLTSNEMNDPVYNSLILKILEAKALDCLCSEYSKQNTQKQISQALAKINQRVDEHQSDSVSVTSSISVPDSYESSSSSVSSILSEDESISSRSITPQLYSPLHSTVQTPSLVQTTSTIVSPDNKNDKFKSSLKLNEDIKTPKKQSKVTMLPDKISKSRKLKKKKHSSSKHRKKSTRTRKKPGKSSKTRKKPSKSKKSTKHSSSSRSKKKKGSSKSPSKNKTHKSTHKKSSKKKSKKPKSNNQVNDHEPAILPTFIYLQSYQQVYKNQQRLLKLLRSST